MCNIEFPHFGASYPDAHCIDGYLWDMDSYEDGGYTIGGDDPCPFCNTEEWLKTVLDNEDFESREKAFAWVEKMREKWGAEHLASVGKTSSKDLEDAARKYQEGVPVDTTIHYCGADEDVYFANRIVDAVIAGAEWQKEQMMKEAVEGKIIFLLNGDVAINIGDTDEYKLGKKSV